MARQKNKVNRSAEIRTVLGQNPDLSAAEVVRALAKKGVTVTVPLVYKVKKNLKKAQKKTATNGRKAEAAPAVASTAKASSDINKSEEIRTVLKATPSASAKDVVRTLANKGITVTEALVYSVKQSMTKGKKKRGRPRVRKVSANGHATNGVVNGDPVQLVLRVKNLAGQVGGLKSLKQLVDALAE